MPTTITNDAWEMLTSFRKPSWIAPGQACRVLALPPKAPPFPEGPSHWHRHDTIFISEGQRRVDDRCLWASVSLLVPGGGPWGRRQHWDPGDRRLRASWACLPQLLALPWLPSKHFSPPTPPASPSPSDQALPGTEAPGCHGNGFQAPVAGFLIGWLLLQAKVSPRVTARGWNRVSSRFPGT